MLITKSGPMPRVFSGCLPLSAALAAFLLVDASTFAALLYRMHKES
jgi:hypothetical protein